MPVSASNSLAASSHQLWSVEQSAVTCWRCANAGVKASAKTIAARKFGRKRVRMAGILGPAERTGQRAEGDHPDRAQAGAQHQADADGDQRDRAEAARAEVDVWPGQQPAGGDEQADG